MPAHSCHPSCVPILPPIHLCIFSLIPPPLHPPHSVPAGAPWGAAQHRPRTPPRPAPAHGAPPQLASGGRLPAPHPCPSQGYAGGGGGIIGWLGVAGQGWGYKLARYKKYIFEFGVQGWFLFFQGFGCIGLALQAPAECAKQTNEHEIM